jgi:hypothetical protein
MDSPSHSTMVVIPPHGALPLEQIIVTGTI